MSKITLLLSVFLLYFKHSSDLWSQLLTDLAPANIIYHSAFDHTFEIVGGIRYTTDAEGQLTKHQYITDYLKASD